MPSSSESYRPSPTVRVLPSDSLLGRPTLGDSAEYCDFVPVNRGVYAPTASCKEVARGCVRVRGTLRRPLGACGCKEVARGCVRVRGTLRRPLGACGCKEVARGSGERVWLPKKFLHI